jgi:hypothetical protein
MQNDRTNLLLQANSNYQNSNGNNPKSIKKKISFKGPSIRLNNCMPSDLFQAQDRIIVRPASRLRKQVHRRRSPPRRDGAIRDPIRNLPKPLPNRPLLLKTLKKRMHPHHKLPAHNHNHRLRPQDQLLPSRPIKPGPLDRGNRRLELQAR